MEIVAIAFAVFAIILVFTAIRVVPQQTADVVERLGKYDRTLDAGPHIIIPFVDRIAYRHSLKELVLDIPEQPCITRDNVVVAVDGVLFLRVMDPSRASYGVANFQLAIVQLAQTTLRSEIGKLDLDRTFEAREAINAGVITALDKATDVWGVKVLRYEIRSISPPREVVEAMEKQMRAEREKHAKILESEGDRDSKINRAEGAKQETIKGSEADRQLQINQAEGQAQAILAIADATADGLRRVAAAIDAPGGISAARLRVAEQWVTQFGQLAKHGNTMIVPANVADITGTLAAAFAVFEQSKTASQPQHFPDHKA